jgi:hypothetical protein
MRVPALRISVPAIEPVALVRKFVTPAIDPEALNGRVVLLVIATLAAAPRPEAEVEIALETAVCHPATVATPLEAVAMERQLEQLVVVAVAA